MVNIRLIGLVAIAVCASAQTPSTAPAEQAEPDGLAAALRWSGALYDQFGKMPDPVVSLYARARLAALVCRQDEAAGSKMFRQAWTDLKSLPDNAFDFSRKPLPVATFSAMWTLVVPAAQSCDPKSGWTDNQLDTRKAGEVQTKPNLWLTNALNSVDPHRARQLAEAAISIGGIWGGPVLTHRGSPDWLLFLDALIKLGKSAPDLSDAVFRKAIAGSGAPVGITPSELELLAKYLFPTENSIRMERIPAEAPHIASLPQPMLPVFTSAPLRGDMDVLKEFLNSAVFAVTRIDPPTSDLAGRYTLAYQMLPKAQMYAPEYSYALETALPALEANPKSYAAANRALIGPIPSADTDEPASPDEFLEVAKEVSDIRASRFEAARTGLPRLGETPIRHQVEALLEFAEAADSLHTKDAEQVLKRPIYSEPGAARALLYASVAAAAKTQDGGFQAIAMALQDIEPLPPIQRACLLTSLASVALPRSADISLALFKRAIDAENDLASRAAESNGSVIGSGPRCEAEGVIQPVDTAEGRLTMLLRVPGVSTFTVPGFVSNAKGLDSSQLESAVRELHDPNQLVDALLAVAETRLAVGGRQ